MWKLKSYNPIVCLCVSSFNYNKHERYEMNEFFFFVKVRM